MKYIAMIFVLLFIFYLAICSTVWQIQNPLGNKMTFWMYLPEALTFGKIDALQVKP